MTVHEKKMKGAKLNESILISVDNLILDSHNPRLSLESGLKTDVEIIAELFVSENLTELLQSISASGYINIEPLVAFVDKKHETYVVLEGNRRLAAIKLFRNTDLRTRVSKQLNHQIALPKISNKNLATMEEVSVHLVPNRESVRTFIGFKHINGPSKWNSFSMANYVAKWHKDEKISAQEIANKIGDKSSTVKKMIVAIYIIEQAEKENIYSLEERTTPRFSFSRFYIAISRKSFREFLNLNFSWIDYEPSPNPVPKKCYKQLKELLVWMYGSEDEDKEALVNSQNPDLTMLGKILANNRGLIYLRTGSSLSEAYEETILTEEKLSDSLVGAEKSLNVASANLKGYDGKSTELFEISKNIVAASEIVHDSMKKKYFVV